MASFNGLDLGFIFWMNPAPNPKARQINTYPGANGLEVLDQGTRGSHTTMEGAMIADNQADLSSLEWSFFSYQVDGSPYVLVDTLGTSWSNVILVQFQPSGRVQNVAGGGYARKYQAEFLHVS